MSRVRCVRAQETREAIELVDQQRFIDRLLRRAECDERDQIDRIDRCAGVDSFEQFDAEFARDLRALRRRAGEEVIERQRAPQS